MVRILHVVGTMDLGGAETFIMNLYRKIDREKVQFDFLCHNRIEAKYTDEILSMGGKMYMVEGISHVGFLKYEKSLYNFFKSHPEYQVVHSHQNDLNGLILKQAARAGVKVRVSHSHTEYHYKSFQRKALFAFFKYNVNRYTTDAFACSKPSGNMLYTGKLKKNFDVIYNGIDTNRFAYSAEKGQTIKDEFNLSNGPIIGHVGRFAPVKNHTFIIDIFNEFLKLYPNAKLVLVGTGDTLVQTKDKVKTLGIEKSILFLGLRTDVDSILSAINIFLFPSIHEGLPLSVVEAQCSGLKVITSDTISEDTVITDLITRMPLSCSAKQWAEKLDELYVNSKSVDRSIYANVVNNAGFGSKQIAKTLVDRYLKKL
ncbi:MAG: glycosyltransferase family 1 protein [Clostridia bacterium]|nr:glycosyltransferase family 1 protein [Clostridia bacterium]